MFLSTNTKIIDSIVIRYFIDRVVKVDSLTLTKDDLGKTQKGIKITDFVDNYISYTYPNSIDIADFYPYRLKALDKNNNQISSRRSMIDILCNKTRKESFKNLKTHYKIVNNQVEKAKTKDEALKIIENLSLDYELLCEDKGYKKAYKFYEGNINKYKLYIEAKHDTMVVDAVYKNHYLNQQYYINTSKSKTKFIAPNSQLLFSVPIGNLTFIESQKDSSNNFYFLESTEGSDKYYHIDVKNKKVTPLNEKMISVYHGYNDEYSGKNSVVNENNKAVTQKPFRRLKLWET